MSGHQLEAERQERLARPFVRVTVVEAKGIKAADLGGTSDPFVALRILGDTQTLKTSTIKKSLTPFWNEEFVLYPSSADIDKDLIELKLYDFDAGTSNDLIGSMEIPVAGLVGKGKVDQWREWGKKKGPGNFKTGKYGEAHLLLEYVDPTAVAPAAQMNPLPGQIPPQPQPQPGPPENYAGVMMAEPMAQQPLLQPPPQPVVVMAPPPNMPQTSPSYVCHKYQPPAPKILDAVAKPTPALRHAENKLKAEQEAAQKQVKYSQKKEKQKHKGGFMGKLGKAALHAAEIVDEGAHKAIDATKDKYHEKSDEASMKRFRALMYPMEERLCGDFHCSVSCGAHEARGWLFISNYFLTFDGKIDKIYTQTPEHVPVRVVIPYTSIVSNRVGTAKQAGTTKGTPATVELNPSEEVPGNHPAKTTFYNALLVYTAEGNLHEFYDFKHFQIDWFEDMYNWLDHAWRGATGQGPQVVPPMPPQMMTDSF